GRRGGGSRPTTITSKGGKVCRRSVARAALSHGVPAPTWTTTPARIPAPPVARTAGALYQTPPDRTTATPTPPAGGQGSGFLPFPLAGGGAGGGGRWRLRAKPPAAPPPAGGRLDSLFPWGYMTALFPTDIAC